MLFFGDSENLSLSQGIASHLNITLHFPEITVFSDGQRRIRLLIDVVGQDVIFLKTASITPNIDSCVLETSFLIDALKRSGAATITGILPHFPYGRGDHLFGTGEAVPLEVIIRIFETAGLTKALFVDPHSVKMNEMFGIPIVNISTLELFSEKIKKLGFDSKNSLLVSPDSGGLARVKALSEYLENAPYISLEKKRNPKTGRIKISKIEESVAPNCYVIDDEIASGATILLAVEELEKQGAKNIYVLATHPVFSGNAAKDLQNSNIKKVIVTDSIPVPHEKKFKKLEVVSLASIIGKKLKNLRM